MEMSFIDMSVKDFINNIIKFKNVEEILKLGKEQRDKGFIYERLWDIVIKLGHCSKFPNSKFIHKIGNVDNCSLKNLENLNSYLSKEKVYSGNKGGKSDITLYNKDDDKYIFISSKFYQIASDDGNIKNKSIDKYGISDIIAMASKNIHLYKKYDIYLVVNNRNLVLEKSSNANKSNKFITEEIKEENILDLYDLNKCFLSLKEDILKNLEKTIHINPELNYNELYLSPKDKLDLRFHQKFITTKTSSLIEEGKKCFLWGCKCRSGKTYMAGGIILKQFDVKHTLNVLIITPAPTETMPQFTEGLFNNFRDFNIFKIHQIDGNNIKKLDVVQNNIFVMSKQFLQNYVNEKTIMTIKNLKLDIIIFDENHFSGTTEKSKHILNSYSTENTIKIYLTATYNKPLKEWLIPDECQMYWDIEDEQICKSIMSDETNINKLKEKHGDIITHTLEYYTNKGYLITDIFKTYLKMPDLCLLTNLYDKERYKKLKEEYMGSKYGFCFETLLSLNDTKTKFNFEIQVKTILRYISGSNKGKDFKFGDKSIFGRINKLCSIKNSRTPYIQIWFLPSDNINEISLCLEKLMNEDTELIKYGVMCINRKNENLPKKDVKDAINNMELKSRDAKKDGLILLVGNMLSLGITIEMCDVVFLMNSTLSSDKVLQQMYRCMTEGDNKKLGIVVDLNISRVLNTFMNYTIYKNELSPDNKVKYLIDNNLINIDVDLMETKKINSDDIVKDLMDIWKSDPINSIKTLLRNLINDYENYDNHIQKKLNSIFTKSLNGETNIPAELHLVSDDEDIQDEIPSGQEKKNKNIIDDDNSDIEEKKKKKEEDIIISFTKDVLPYIIPLTCILTIKNTNTDFVKMLNDIKDNKELLEIFDDQCFIWWNKKDLIDFIKSLVIKYFDKSSNTYKVSVQIKTSMKQLIDSPTELLELINYSLRPKDIEKKQFGEVFTSMILVNEMLDNLPKEVWINKDLKWFDPATGMGNFPIAVYLRLMETLKDIILDNDSRKQHILENMLYMCELNKKNVLITKQIFDINNMYKLNLYEGDSLLLDTNKEWNIKHFDIIMGNPPYQKNFENNNNRVGGSSLWSEFINKSFQILNNNGYLVFISPCSWMTGGSNKQSGNILNGIMQKYTLLYLNIEECAKYFNNVASTFSYYVVKKSFEELDFECICEYKHKIYKSTISNNNFRKLSVIPKIFTNEMVSIIYKVENANNNKFNFQRLRDLDSSAHIKRYSNTGKFEVRHKVVDIRKTDWEQECMNKDKIVISMPGYLKTTYDKSCGCSDATLFMYVKDEKEGERLIELLQSTIYQLIINSYRELTGLNNHKNINRLSIIDDIHKINFTEQEVQIINNIMSIKKETQKSDYQTIKHKRKNYYLFENKVYSINKNKSLGELFGDYVNDKIVEIIKNNIEVVKNIKPVEKNKSKIDYQVVKHKRKNYYLVENKVYSISKNKSLGNVFGDYVNEKVIELKLDDIKPDDIKLEDIKLDDIKPVKIKHTIIKKKSIFNMDNIINT